MATESQEENNTDLKKQNEIRRERQIERKSHRIDKGSKTRNNKNNKCRQLGLTNAKWLNSACLGLVHCCYYISLLPGW